MKGVQFGWPVQCKVYAIKVTLLGISPPVWRRILVDRDITLSNLHLTLQTVMGWENSHLHQFVFPRQKESNYLRHGSGTKIGNESRARLGDLIGARGSEVTVRIRFRRWLAARASAGGSFAWRRILPADLCGGGTMLSAGRLRRTARIC